MTDVSRVTLKTVGTANPVLATALDCAGRLILQAGLPAALAALFLWDGFSHFILAWPTTVAHMRNAGLYPPTMLCAMAGALVIVGAVALLVPPCRRFGALSLAAYTWLASLAPHATMSVASCFGFAPHQTVDMVLVSVLVLVAVRGPVTRVD